MSRILYFTIVLAFVRADFSENERRNFKGDMLEDSFAVKSDILDPKYLWPGNTIVYSIDIDFPYEDMFYTAIKHITGRTCIRFRERLMNETDFLYVMQDEYECYSDSIGMSGGQQNISLGLGCGYFIGTHLHELVHTIGFWHEHCRDDRDQFVTINTENYDEKDEPSFKKLNLSYASPFGVPYDYWSVVHYPRYAESKDFKDTITPMDPDVKIGQARVLSKFDIKKINNKYCAGTIGIRIQNLADGMYLTVANDSDPVRPVIASNWTGEENQNWTSDWYALRNHTKGSPLATWNQDATEFVKVLIELGSNVYVWRDTNATNTKWWIDRVLNAKDSRWRIINKHSRKCITSMGASQVVTAQCTKNDQNQLWKIYSA